MSSLCTWYHSAATDTLKTTGESTVDAYGREMGVPEVAGHAAMVHAGGKAGGGALL